MRPLVSAALLVAAFAPLVEARAWRVPLRYVPLARMARTFLGAGVITGLAGGLAWLVLMQAEAEARVTALTAAGLAWVFGMLVAWSSARRDRRLRGLHVLVSQLGLPERRDPAAAYIDERLERERSSDARQHALLTLFAAGPLTRHGLSAMARKHLGLIADQELSPSTAALRAQLYAMSYLHDGALEAARDALQAAPYPSTPEVDAWIDLTRALADVVCGGVASARALLAARREAADVDPALRLHRDTVEAHALAAEGDEAGARAVLLSLLQRSGAGALALALRPVGPATDLARATITTHLAGAETS